MESSSKIRGYCASAPEIEGEVIVIAKPFDLLSIEPISGTFEAEHEHEGKSIKDKILLAPCLCGATIAEFIPLFLGMVDNRPKAIVTTESMTYVPIMSGCLAAGIPLMFGVDKEFYRSISTGDTLRIDAEKGVVSLQ
ncbi:MAG: aconitase X swivel domain-containing protein [Actinomycetota bacterium]